MKWIKVEDRLPTKREQEKNWKFMVCNNMPNGEWTDCAYYNPNDKDDMWNNGECTIIPTHWAYLPKVAKD